MHIRIIATAVTALTAILATPAFAQTPLQEGPFTTSPCKSGCITYDNHPSTIYTGAVAKSYRACSGDGYSVEVVVDNRLVKIAGGDCADVNGTNLILKYDKTRAGRLPE